MSHLVGLHTSSRRVATSSSQGSGPRGPGAGPPGAGPVSLRGAAGLDDRTRFGLVVMEVQVLLGGRAQRLAITDFSRRGAFIETVDPAPIGTVVHLEAPLLASERLPIRARVVRTITATDASIARTLPGMGVLFFGISASAQRIVDAFLTALELMGEGDLPGRLEPYGMTFGAYRLQQVDAVARNVRRRTALDLMASGRAAFEQGAFVRAALDLCQAIQLDPGDVSMRGWAERACQRAADAKARVCFQLGVYAEQRGDAEAALRYYTEASVLAPGNPEYRRRAMRQVPAAPIEPGNLATDTQPDFDYGDTATYASWVPPSAPTAASSAPPPPPLDAEALFELAPVGLAALDPDGTLVKVNARFAEALGFASAALVGRHLVELAAAEDRQDVHRAVVALREGGRARFEWRAAYIRRGGKLVGLRLAATPSFDASGTLRGAALAIEGIESVARAPEAADYRALVEHTGEAIVVHSRGSLVYGNSAAARLLGATSTQDLPGRRLADLLVPEHRPLANAREAEITARGADNEPLHVTLVGAEGQGVDVELLGTAVRHGDGPAVAEVIRDVSHHKTKLQRMARWVEDLSRSNEELQQVVTLLEARLGEAVAAETRGEAGRVARLQADLSAYVRAQKDSLRMAPVDLSKALAEALERLEPLLEATGGRVEAGPLPLVRADGAQITAALEHLVRNALTHAGRAGAVEVSARRDGPGWTVSVVDRGPGLHARDAERVFRLFERAGTSAGGEGAGLGLAISRRIVERHGGRIWIEDTPGGGATVRFTLGEV